jgi:hypothetical protein
MRRRLSDSFLGLGLLVSVLGVGCTAPDLSSVCNIPGGATDCERSQAIAACAASTGNTTVDLRLTKDLDILFVIDNSVSMSPKQRAISAAIPGFMKTIDDLRANYHIGVITTDIGTLPPGKTAFPGSPDPRCSTAKGDDGLLQNKPCSARIPAADQNSEFAQACNGNPTAGIPALCPDASFVPRDLFISKTGNELNVIPNNAAGLPASTIAERAFKCIGLVGDYGCGVESPLESMKRSLDGHLSENRGFMRDNSVLAVIFITDEDDCSVKLAQRSVLDPTSASCDPNDPAPGYNCFNLDYRCIAKSLVCDEPMTTPGLKHNCREADGNFLEPTDKYVKFLSALRRSDRLVVAGIWTPSLQDFAARGHTGAGRLEVDTTSAGDYATNLLNRGEKTKAACYDPDPQMKLTSSPKGFFGQAQYRLSSFIRKLAPDVAVERSICDAASYPSALDAVADKVRNKLGANCLEIKPAYANGMAQCQVGFVDSGQPGALPDAYLGQCSATCCQAWAGSTIANPSDPAIISACMPEAADCFCAVPSTVAPTPVCADTAIAGVWRAGGAPLPTGKDINFRCAGAPLLPGC